MDTPPMPPKPAAWPEPDLGELPLLTDTVGEPAIPLLSEVVPAAAPAPAAPATPEPASSVAARADKPAAAAMPLAQIERELHAAAQLIVQEVIDDYMLQIEAELHRRLEDHLASILRAGRR